MPTLAVNVDHVATVRQARRGTEPDPVHAAYVAEHAGAAGIIAHLREDRRHVLDRDVEILARTVKTRFNLEMAATVEMRDIALACRPASVCLVPEKREELTTEGGLDVAGRVEELAGYVAPIRAAGIAVSLFIDPEADQIEAAAKVDADMVELHTGAYADATAETEARREFERLERGLAHARERGLIVNMGHGLNYVNILPFASLSGVHEYSIGHSIISRAVLVGLDTAVRDMLALISRFPD